MRGGSERFINRATCSNSITKDPDLFGLGGFSQVIADQYVFRTIDQIGYDAFPEIVRQRDPVDLRLPISLKERRGILSCCDVRRCVVDEEEIAFFGGEHHVIPIDDEYLAGVIADHIARV